MTKKPTAAGISDKVLKELFPDNYNKFGGIYGLGTEEVIYVMYDECVRADEAD
jgi:hypothetical protein